MNFENSQDPWAIDLPENVKDIGLKISGGADSAIVCYMLAKYITEERPDITIHPVTGVSVLKGYQLIYSSQVLQKIESLTSIKFAKHQTRTVSNDNYVRDQDMFIKFLYKKNLFAHHYTGITANPTIDQTPELYTDQMPVERNRGPKKHDNTFSPLINIDKRGVSEHYTRLGVLEELFPLTRSCEDLTDNFDTHCETCWFCQERFWGFNRYV